MAIPNMPGDKFADRISPFFCLTGGQHDYSLNSVSGWKSSFSSAVINFWQ